MIALCVSEVAVVRAGVVRGEYDWINLILARISDESLILGKAVKEDKLPWFHRHPLPVRIVNMGLSRKCSNPTM